MADLLYTFGRWKVNQGSLLNLINAIFTDDGLYYLTVTVDGTDYYLQY